MKPDICSWQASVRKIENAPKRAAKMEKKAKVRREKEDSITAENILFEAAKTEMQTIMAKAMVGVISKTKKGKTQTLAPQLGILYFTIFEKETDEQLEKRYPNTSRNLRYKRRERARDFVWPKASANLRHFLSRDTSRD